MDIGAGNTANNFQPTTQNPQSSNQAGESQELQPSSTADLLQRRNLKIEVPSNPQAAKPVATAKPDYFIWWLVGLVAVLALVAVVLRRRRQPATPKPLLEPIELPDETMTMPVARPVSQPPKPTKPKTAKKSKSKRKKRARH